MHVAVCIVGFANLPDIVACLAALGRSTHADYEVVICENGSATAHAALVAGMAPTMPGGQPVRILHAGDNPGYAGAVNRCMLDRPDADAWWVVNPDAEPEPEAMAALVARLAVGDVDAVGGTVYLPDGRVQGHGGRWRSWLARAESIGNGTSASTRADPGRVEPAMDYLLGASMMVGRRFVATAGLMREDYFLYGEEIEWFVRARRMGLRLGFAPAARVLHSQGATTGSARALAERPRLPIYLDERNKLNIVRDSTPARLPVAAIAALGLTFLRFGRRGAWSQWRHALQGWWAGVRNRRGKPDWIVAGK